MINEIYKVSIIVPVYNAESYLKKCLESLINQSYKNLDIILVDDGSKDNSGKICDRYANIDKRCRVFHIENSGSSGARNFGLNCIQGDLIMFVDADDWLDLDCIEICISKIINNEDVDCVIFSYIREFKNISRKNKILGNQEFIISGNEMKNKIYRRLFGPIEREKAHPDAMHDLNPPWGKLYFKKFLRDIQFIDVKKIGPAEDVFFNIEVFYHFNKVLYIPNVYYHYNKMNELSMLHTYNNNLFITRKNFQKYVFEFIKKNKLGKDFYEALNNRIIFDLLGLSRNVMNSNETLCKKYLLIKNILNDNEYKVSFKKFNFKYLDLKWRIYYFFCKKSFVLGVMIMTFLAEKLKKYLR
jgi:glycosyltransferase involved in cell wall biosynthesis